MQIWSKLKIDFNISHLPESIKDILYLKKDQIHESGLLVFPYESNSPTFPKKVERLKIFKSLISSIMSISFEDFKIENCKNRINDDLSYNYFIISFKTKEQLDRFYNLQPYYQSIIFHKLSHCILFPLIRSYEIKQRYIESSFSFCLTCVNSKNNLCPFNLCSLCCYNALIKKDNHIYNLLSSILGDCNVCPKNEKINLNSVKVDDDSILPLYIMDMMNMDLSDLKEYIDISKKYFILHFLDCLKNSCFINFFRHVSNTSKTRMMLDMNKELVIVMDNSNHKRDSSITIHDRMYKCFTFQNNKINEMKLKSKIEVGSGFDMKGEYFIDYNFDGEVSKTIQHYIPQNDTVNQIDSLSYKEFEKSCLSSFHIILYGVENLYLSNQEVVDDCFFELKRKGIKINKEDINIISLNGIISKCNHIYIYEYEYKYRLFIK